MNYISNVFKYFNNYMNWLLIIEWLLIILHTTQCTKIIKTINNGSVNAFKLL